MIKFLFSVHPASLYVAAELSFLLTVYLWHYIYLAKCADTKVLLVRHFKSNLTGSSLMFLIIHLIGIHALAFFLCVSLGLYLIELTYQFKGKEDLAMIYSIIGRLLAIVSVSTVMLFTYALFVEVQF